jgi:hypothetical protein
MRGQLRRHLSLNPLNRASPNAKPSRDPVHADTAFLQGAANGRLGRAANPRPV